MPVTPLKSKLVTISSGEKGTEETIAYMKQLSAKSSVNPEIIQLARDIVKSTPEGNDYEKAKAIRNWVVQNIRYEKDVEGVETITEVIELLRQTRVEDCDGQATLVASLLLAIGIPVRFVVIGPKGNRTHVFCEALLNEKWMSVDTVDRIHEVPFEYTQPKRIFSMDNDKQVSMLKSQGLAGLSQDPQWLTILQRGSSLITSVNTMKREGKITDADIKNAVDSINSVIPSEAEGTLTPQTIKNIPLYCSLYKTGTKVANVVMSPTFKIVMIFVVGGIVIWGATKLSRRK